MKARILLADGFETVEALLTYDILKRSHRFDVALVSCNEDLNVVSSQGVRVQAEELLSSITVDSSDMLILPGGKKGVDNLHANKIVLNLILEYLKAGKDVHAICAAPSILGDLGVLDGLPYTCFPGFQRGEGVYQDVGAVETPHIITGRSMGFTMDFAKTIVSHYYGQEAVEAIRPGVEGLA